MQPYTERIFADERSIDLDFVPVSHLARRSLVRLRCPLTTVRRQTSWAFSLFLLPCEEILKERFLFGRVEGRNAVARRAADSLRGAGSRRFWHCTELVRRQPVA